MPESEQFDSIFLEAQRRAEAGEAPEQLLTVRTGEDGGGEEEDPSRLDQLFELSQLRGQLGLEPLTTEELEPMGFLEGLTERGVTGFIPFVGGGVEMYEIGDIYFLAEKVGDGTASKEEEQELMNWYLDQQTKVARGTTVWGTTGEIVSQLPAFGGEFLLTGGIYTAGRKVGVKVAKHVIGKAVSKIANRKARHITYKTSKSVAGGVAGAVAQATVAGAISGRWGAETFHNLMPEMGFTEDEAGELALAVNESDTNLGTALFRGWASQVREFGSERLGWMIGSKGLGKVMKTIPMADQVKGWRTAVAKRWLQSGPGRTVGGFRKVLNKMGYHGIIGEMFEERAGEFMDVPIDAMTIGEASYALPGWDQLAAEAMAFAIPGGLAAVADVGARKRWLKKVGRPVIAERAKEIKEGRPAEAVEEEVVPVELEEPLFELREQAGRAVDTTRPHMAAVITDAEGNEVGRVPYNREQARNVRGTANNLIAEWDERGEEYRIDLVEEGVVPAARLGPDEVTPGTQLLREAGETEEGFQDRLLERRRDAGTDTLPVRLAEVEEAVEVEAPPEEAAEVEEERLPEPVAAEPGVQGVLFAATEGLPEGTPVAEESDIPSEARPSLQEDLNNITSAAQKGTRTESNPEGVAHTARVVPRRDQDRDTRRLAVQTRKSGIRLVVVDVQAEDGRPAFVGVQSPSDPRVVYIQDIGQIEDPVEQAEAFQNNFIAILSHEAMHTLEDTNRGLFDFLVSRAPAEVAEGISAYSKKGPLGKRVIEEGGPTRMVSEGMATAIQTMFEQGRISTDPKARTMWEQFSKWVREWAARVGLTGQLAVNVQNVVDQILEGKDIAEITLPGQARGLERARRRGLAPRERAAAPRERAAPRFAPAPAEAPNPLAGMSESVFRRTYSQHIDIRHREDGQGAERISTIQEQGWKPGFGVNTLPISMGTPPQNVIEERFTPRIGDVVYLVPNSAVNKQGKIESGWKPKEHEVLVIDRDNPNIHEIATSAPPAPAAPRFTPAPAAEETPEERAARERIPIELIPKRERKAEVRRRTGVLKGDVEERRALKRGLQKEAAGARRGFAVGKTAGFQAAEVIAGTQLERLKDKTATVERIKSDLVGWYERIFRGRDMRDAGYRDIRKLLNAVKNAKTKKNLEDALVGLEKLSAKLTWQAVKVKGKGAITKKNMAKKIPIEFRAPLDALAAELDKAIKTKPVDTVEEYDDLTEEIEGIRDALLSKLHEARSERNEIVLQRKMTEGRAIVAIVDEVKAGRNPLKGWALPTAAEASWGSRVWTWHMDMKSMVQRITGDLSEDTNLYSLMVDNFRRAEEAYNEALRDIQNKLEEAAKRAGFRNLEDANNKMSGTHGMALADTFEVQLGGTGRLITLGEAMHLILMDPMTRANIQKGAPLQLKRGEEVALENYEGVTLEEFDGVISALEAEYGKEQSDKYVAFAEEMKTLLETDVKPAMFAAYRRIKGFEPEEVADYFPRSRARDAKTELSVEKFLSGAIGASKVMTMFLENAGMTQRRAKGDYTTPFVLTSALTTFINHADTAFRIAHMAEPIRLADKVLRADFTLKDEDGNIIRDKNKKAVKVNAGTEIKKRWGVAAYKTLREYVLSASGMREGFKGTIDRWVGVASSNVATSYLAMNPRTWLIQPTAIPRFLTHFSFTDLVAGVKWMTQNIGSIRKILSEESGYFWRRWARSSSERFGPQKYGQHVPIDGEGFVRGVSNTMTNLLKMDRKGAYKSWSSMVDAIKILDAFDGIAAGTAYGAARSKLEREGLSGRALTKQAAYLASEAMRDTQNSTSTLDLTMGALAGRQNSLARPFLMFTSDPLKTTNILAQGWRLIQEGRKTGDASKTRRGSAMIMGMLTSAMGAVSVRALYFGTFAGVVAAIGGDDDDKKKAERAEESNDRWMRGIVRELSGITFFAPIIDMGYARIAEGSFTWGDPMANPISSLITQTVVATDRMTTAFTNLKDEEQDQVVRKFIFATIRAGNEWVSLVVGNPLRPLINDVRKFGEATITDPVRDVRGLERYYKEITSGKYPNPPKDLTAEQKAYFVRSMAYMKSIRKLDTMISERKKILERLLTAGQEDRAMKVREALQTLRDKRREIAQEALGEIRPSGESE